MRIRAHCISLVFDFLYSVVQGMLLHLFQKKQNLIEIGSISETLGNVVVGFPAVPHRSHPNVGNGPLRPPILRRLHCQRLFDSDFIAFLHTVCLSIYLVRYSTLIPFAACRLRSDQPPLVLPHRIRSEKSSGGIQNSCPSSSENLLE